MWLTPSWFNCPTYWAFSGSSATFSLGEYLPLLSSPCQWHLHGQASPIFLLAHTYLYPSCFLLDLGPVPDTTDFILKTEAARSSKTLVYYCNTTWHHNPKDFNLNHNHSENLKSCNYKVFWVEDVGLTEENNLCSVYFYMWWTI